ncbi:uncharacterized protein LOC144653814 [Oculina patagonica]
MMGLKLFVGILTLYVAAVCSAPMFAGDEGIAKALSHISNEKVYEKIDQDLRKQIPGEKVDALEKVLQKVNSQRNRGEDAAESAGNKRSFTGTIIDDSYLEDPYYPKQYPQPYPYPVYTTLDGTTSDKK